MRPQTAIVLSILLLVPGGCNPQAGTSQIQDNAALFAAKKIKAPEFELTDLGGNKINLKDLRGKVVFLDFWATWCGPCVMSIPEVEKMVEDYQGKDVVVLSISLDEDVAPVKKFMATHKMTNRVAMAGRSRVDEKYSVSGIPSYFVINKEGNVANAWEGYNPIMPSLWRKELDRLLKT